MVTRMKIAIVLCCRELFTALIVACRNRTLKRRRGWLKRVKQICVERLTATLSRVNFSVLRLYNFFLDFSFEEPYI